MDNPSVVAATAAVRDRMRGAAAKQRQAVSNRRPWNEPSDVGVVLGNLSATVTAMDRLLDDLIRGLMNDTALATVESVDGPFQGDLPDAVVTAQMWLACATEVCATLQGSIDNAHIAVGGFARRPGAPVDPDGK